MGCKGENRTSTNQEIMGIMFNDIEQTRVKNETEIYFGCDEYTELKQNKNGRNKKTNNRSLKGLKSK